MMLRGVLIGLCLALLFGPSAQAVPDRNWQAPDWVTRPTPERIFWAFPARAASEHLEGVAVISCTVNVQGLATRCRVVSESPEGYGFGEAALTLAEDFRFRPAVRNGRSEEAEVRVPITFRIPPETPSAPEVSTDAMTAARRVVAALGGQEAFVKQMENLAAAILDQPVTGGDLNAEERRRLYEAVQAVTRQYREESVEALAHTYAQNLSLSDLQAYAAFLESPAGQRLAASQMGLEPVRSELEGFRQRVIQSLRERVCGPVRPCRPTRSELGGH